MNLSLGKSNFLISSINDADLINRVPNVKLDNSSVKRIESIKPFDFPKLVNYLKDVPADFHEIIKHDHVANEVMKNNDVIVRVYVIYLFGLTNKDLFAGDKSDPYCKLTLNGKIYNDKDKHVNDKDTLWWCQFYE